MNQTTDELNNGDQASSKSARKREMAALQDLGKSLLDLPEAKLADIPLSEDLREALALARRLKQREALRRQLQFIGKQMRKEDHEKIASAIQHLNDQDQFFRQHFHKLEKLRDSLIAGGDEFIEPLVRENPQLDRQQLRQLVRLACREQSEGKPPSCSRKLFRYLRENLEF